MTTVTITTAVKLSAKQLSDLAAAIEKKYGKQIKYEQVVDPNVIGGIRVKIGSQQIDRTISHKLAQLKNQLLNI